MQDILGIDLLHTDFIEVKDSFGKNEKVNFHVPVSVQVVQIKELHNFAASNMEIDDEVH